MPLRVVILGGNKSDWFPLQVLKLIGYFFRSVKSKPKNVRILSMGIGESFPFYCYFLQHIRVNKKLLKLIDHLRETLARGMNQPHRRQIPGIPVFLRNIPGQQKHSVSKGSQFMVRYHIQFALRHISPQIKQFPDTFCRLFPSKQSHIPPLCAVATGNSDTICVVPESILAVIHIKACTILAIMRREKLSIFLHRMVFHKIRTDNQPTLRLIGTDAQCFVNNLLRKLRTRHKRELSDDFLRRSVEICKIEQC